MTVRIVEQDGKWYAYHAHIVYNQDPATDPDFDPNDNSTVEVMAPLPHSSFLSLEVAPQEGMLPTPQKMLAVYCPDPECGSVSYYPSNGDPEAREVHRRHKADKGARAKLDPANVDANKAELAKLKAYVANAWARADLGMDPVERHTHLGAMVDGANRQVVASGAKEISALAQRAKEARAAQPTA